MAVQQANGEAITLVHRVMACIEQIRNTPVAAFRPSAVQKRVGAPLKDVVQVLLDMAADDSLGVEWETVCPKCFNEIDTSPEKPTAEEGKYCWHCGEEVWVGPEDATPIFFFPEKRKKGAGDRG